MAKVNRALISVTDKTALADLAQRLHQLNVELISTGGTARAIRDAGLPVRDVADVTRFPEMLDGRVKTLHPHIAGGILAMRARPDHVSALAEHGIEPIGLVVVNLYDFARAAADPQAGRAHLIENIDIGGPTMIRAAAKNYTDVAVLVTPAQYDAVLREMETNEGEVSETTRWRLAKEAFAHTAAYDAAITERLRDTPAEPPLPATLQLSAPRLATLRYGENPHQQAALYLTNQAGEGLANAEQLHGKELSYNNLVDLDAAWQLIAEFDAAPAAAIIKHTNPCGCAQAPTQAEAYRLALEADPISAFGGVLAFNRSLDAETAEAVSKLFVEAIAAPGFTVDALAILKAKKNLRLVAVRKIVGPPAPVLKSISGGLLLQTADDDTAATPSLQVKTKRPPSPAESQALPFAWRVVKHVKSNAIAYCRGTQLLAAGAGQMSRVDAVKVGAMKAVLPLAPCVLASDAFFPFPDGLELAVSHGVTAVIQPGGSVKDQEVIAAADRLDVAMVFTGIRHFRH